MREPGVHDRRHAQGFPMRHCTSEARGAIGHRVMGGRPEMMPS